jgi:hypothetical protein
MSEKKILRTRIAELETALRAEKVYAESLRRIILLPDLADLYRSAR